jgi:hypothetical protein
MRFPGAVLLLAGALSLSLYGEQPGEPNWKMQFFHDKLDSTLIFEDLDCSSAAHCVAVGAISKGDDMHPTALVTSDGGEHWTYVDLKDTPYSVFFLNDSLGWITGAKKVWRTENGGLKWSDIAKVDDLEQAVFQDANHGWAAGRDGKLYETVDGGKKWTNPSVGGLTWPEKQIGFAGIAFPTSHAAFAIGTAFPFGQLRVSRPEWLDPHSAQHYRTPPAMSFLVMSKDEGRTWQTGSTFSKTGTVANVHPTREGHALVVMRYPDGSEWPSAVLDVDPAGGEPTVVFREKNRIVRDALPLPDGGVMIAAIEPPGTSAALPIPGKLKMIQQDGGNTPHEHNVDYRAVASNALLASSDGKNFWVATDTGMILRFEPSGGNKLPGH